MRKLLALFVFSNCLLPGADCQVNYWQQQVNFTIDVSLNDKENTLDGFEKIEYINNSPDTLHFIWFHIWPNAYKNDKTAFSDQLLENGSTKFYFSNKEDKGYINRLDFKIDGATAEIQDHPQHIDIIKVMLPGPLAPKKSITITTPFHVKLPYNFSRGGHEGQSYQVTQWFPKPAVYDSKGWHPMPYLDQGEYYSEFGNFDVTINLPANYVVAATGELQNEEEKEWLKSRSSFTWKPVKRKEKTKGGQVKTIIEKFPASFAKTKTVHFKQNNVHDFAWFADKRFIVAQDTCKLPSGKIVAVSNYVTSAEKDTWQKSIQYTKQAVRFYSVQLGDYPYTTVNVVQGPISFGGGMEYPGITILSPVKTAPELDLLIAHEIGHNWFYSAIGNNERDHAWMDEGINTFYENLYKETYHINLVSRDKIHFETTVVEKTDQPIETVSEKFSEHNYGLVTYYKASEWIKYLRSQLGDDIFNKAMQEYYRRWQSRHPAPQDLKQIMEETSGKNLDSVFSLLNKKGLLPGQQNKKTKLAFFPNIHSLDSYTTDPPKNLITIGPAIGINSYDKIMIGAVITNLKMPPSRFQFFLAPMYAIGSKSFTGLGFMNYSFYPDGVFRKIDLGVSASTFSMNEFKKEDGGKVFFNFKKAAPGIRLTLKEKNPRSTMHHFLQWKTYLISEQSYRVRYDSVFNPPDTIITQHVNKQSASRTLNQFMAVIENYRALYPYRGELKIEQGDNFLRTAFTGKYFLNYAKEGGLNVRLFAGKFFYSGSKTLTKQFSTDRYHLNLTGANGYEDYTYSDYFIGRNKFEGAASQQIMERDGGFKIRTNLLGDKIGKTDDWLIAINFSSSIPSKINPFSLLPFKIPLKVFADIGTYAEAWDRNANTNRFLFDAGIHIPLFKETINIYVPLIYSREFKDYVQSYLPKKNRFLRTISFSIDISNFSFRKFDRNIPL